MKKLIFLIFVFSLAIGSFTAVRAQEQVEIDFFYSPTCPHCAEEEVFLEELKEKYPEVKIHEYDVVNNQENREFLKGFYERYKVPKPLQGLVPATFTPIKYFVGFNEQIAKDIEGCLGECLIPDGKGTSLEHTTIIEKSVKIPFWKEVKLSDLSFPVMAVVLGIFDGFNVCSLSALILILSLVLAFHSRKKILAFGGIYILTTATVYGFLIFFWYKLFEAITPYFQIINILIGVLGIGGGIYFFKQFFDLKNKPQVCESDAAEKVSSRFLPKLQGLFKNSSSIFLALGAVFAFALILTVVEFPCSAVIPVAFAAVLAEAGLPPFLYITYIAIFVLFYLLDEIIVFLFAVLTSKIWLNSPKFFKWIVLLEAIILFSLGLYYLSSLWH